MAVLFPHDGSAASLTPCKKTAVQVTWAEVAPAEAEKDTGKDSQ